MVNHTYLLAVKLHLLLLQKSIILFISIHLWRIKADLHLRYKMINNLVDVDVSTFLTAGLPETTVLSSTRKLCYRKDNCAMRPIHGCLENFRNSLTIPNNFHGLLFGSTL